MAPEDKNEDDQAREFERVKRETLLQQQQDLAATSGTKQEQRNALRAVHQNRKNKNGGEQEGRGVSDLLSKKSQKRLQNIIGQGKQTLRDIKQDLSNTYDLDMIGTILFTGLLGSAVLLDSIDISTGGVWVLFGFFILKVCQAIGMFFALIIVTGDPIRALLNRRMAINWLFNVIVENIPLVNGLPWHTFVVIITVIDLKTNFLGLGKYIKRDSTKEMLKFIKDSKE